jgi:polyhydroxyalkanoate synthesis repressor PhaR
MPLIKRYPNRKLYDTNAKRYITLAGIAILIRQGQEVEVVDHASGKDLTAVTLTQVIFEQEKKRQGFLPRSVLTGLIRSGGETLTNLRNSLASPLDLARHVDEEIERRVESLTRRGELAAEDGNRLRDKLLMRGVLSAADRQPSDEEIEGSLVRLGVASMDNLETVKVQVAALAAQVEGLSITRA